MPASRPGAGRRTFAAAASATAVTVAGTLLLVPSSDSDYWTVSAADAAAAAIEPTDQPLAPLAPTRQDGSVAGPLDDQDADDGPTATTPESSIPESTIPESTIPGSTIPETTVPVTTTVPPVPELSRPVRIVVAGDSTAEATGFGLVGWAAASPEIAQVELDAVPGCGFVRGGAVLVQDWRPVPERCDQWLDVTLPANVEALEPDVVMLKTTSWDVLDHRWAEGEQYGPGDPVFRERIERDFAEVTDRLLDRGASTVVWVRQSLPNPLWLSSGQAQEDPARHEVLYETMAAIAAERPGRVVVVELDEWLAGRGLDDDVDIRPDGVHWSPDASRLIADDYLGDQLVRAALGLPRP